MGLADASVILPFRSKLEQLKHENHLSVGDCWSNRIDDGRINCQRAGRVESLRQSFANPSPKKNVAPRQPQIDSQLSASLSILKSKEALERALSEMYRLEHNLAERGRIWAETKDEWTDILVIEWV